MNWVDELKKNISKLEADLADANSRFVPTSPQVRIIHEKLESARNSLRAAGDTGDEKVETINPVYQDLQRNLETARTTANVAKAKETAVRGEIARADTQLRNLNDIEVKIKSLLRAANLTEDTLHVISQANDRATLLAKLQGDKVNNISVVQPATLPLRPVAPNRLMLLMLGMFVAGTGAIGLGLASESLSRSTKRPEDIDRLSGLPCVSVPVIDAHTFFGKPAAKSNASLLSRLLPAPAEKKQTLVTRAIGTSGPMMLAGSNGSTDIRPVRRWSPQLLTAAHGIIDGLLFDSIRMAKHQTAFVTGLVSCRPGQGASTLSAYVASAIADRLEASLPLHPDDRVLLVDGDLSEPSLHRLLSIDDSPGLGDWLSISHMDAPSVNEFVHPTNHARLSVMPSGQSSSLTRLLDRMDLLVDETTRHYRHMVIDLPPVSSSPTALRLAAKCNAVLLVVECGNLHQEVVRKSVRALQAAGANVAGVVLNKRRFPIPDWLYERAA
jgi:Mrp family chromosome partitioning ATPase/capsular polysaccharide biosynthesis protein